MIPGDPPKIESKLWSRLNSNDTVYDVGANVGQSLRFAKIAKEIVCFEPLDIAIPELEKTISDFGIKDKTKVAKYAVYDYDGELTLGLDNRREGWVGQLSKFYGDNIHNVSCITLDTAINLFPVPSFVKVDVEGSELEVINGSQKLIKDFKPNWLIEIHKVNLGEKIHKILSDNEYDLEIVRHPTYKKDSDTWRKHYYLLANK